MGTDPKRVLPARAADLVALGAEEVEKRAKQTYGTWRFHARRTVDLSVELGLLLLALRECSPHGTWLDKLQRLGITIPRATRMMSLAEHAELVLAALEQTPDLT
jgi:hypothetical protein